MKSVSLQLNNGTVLEIREEGDSVTFRFASTNANEMCVTSVLSRSLSDITVGVQTEPRPHY